MSFFEANEQIRVFGNADRYALVFLGHDAHGHQRENHHQSQNEK